MAAIKMIAACFSLFFFAQGEYLWQSPPGSVLFCTMLTIATRTAVTQEPWQVCTAVESLPSRARWWHNWASSLREVFLSDVTDRLLIRYEAGVRRFESEDFSGLRLQRSAGGEVANLAGSVFSNCFFTDCVMGAAIFDGSDFTGSEFDECNAIDASFVDCDFSGVQVMESAFGRADFFRAKFIDANVHWVNFRQAYFQSSSWSGAKVVGCKFIESIFGFNSVAASQFLSCDFSEIRMVGLAEIDRATVSDSLLGTIIVASKVAGDSQSSQESKLQSRRSLRTTQDFFVGSGVSRDAVASYSGSADWQLPAEFYDVFISYSTKDEAFAEELYTILNANGIEAWFAPRDIRAGRKIESQVKTEIDRRAKTILVLSEASMESNWVASELRRAVSVEERDGVRKLFPIRIVDYQKVESWSLFDADLGDDLGRRVREYFIPDFSQWSNPRKLAEASARLARDLRRDSS